MDKISRILIPFNFSRTSKKALDYAVDFIGQNKKMSILLCHITKEPNTEGIEADFEAIIDEFKIKDRIKWLVASGPLTSSLIKIQKEENIDLIIMGTFGMITDDNVAMTNTTKVVLDVECPVLVVPYHTEEFKLKNIVFVLGKEEIEDKRALGTLLDISRKFNAKVHVVTIENRPESYGYSDVDKKNENTLAYYLENFYSDHTFIENPDILEGILGYATEKAIDLIAILPRNHSKKSKASAGQLTNY